MDVNAGTSITLSSLATAALNKDIKAAPSPRFWKRSERSTWIATLFIGTTILFSSRVAMPVCATAMAKEFGWNKKHLGTVMGCFFWGYATTQVLGGYLADRFGGDRVLTYASLIWGMVTAITPQIAYLYSDSWSTLVLLGIFRVILGCSQGLHYPSMASLLGKNVRESHRSFSMGVISSGSNFGSLLCGGIGAVILKSHSWCEVFYVVGGFALLWSLLISRHTNSLQQGTSLARYTNVIKNRLAVACALSTHFCMNASYFIMLMWFPTFFEETFPNEKAYVSNVVPWLMSIPASIFGGWLSARLVKLNYSVTFTRKFIQTIAMFGSGLFAMILPFCTEYTNALVVAGLAVSCQTFHSSAVLVNPQDIAPSYSGSVFGIMNTAGAIPGFLGVYFTGYILEASGSWTTVFGCVFATNLVGLTIFLIGGTVVLEILDGIAANTFFYATVLEFRILYCCRFLMELYQEVRY